MTQSNRKLWQTYREEVSKGLLPDLTELGVPGLLRRRDFAPSIQANTNATEILEKMLNLWSDLQTGFDEYEDVEVEKGQEEKVFDLCMEMFHTIKFGKIERFKELVDAQVPVNFQHPKSKETALHMAAGMTAWNWVKVLGEHPDTDFLIRDSFGRLPWNTAEYFALDTETAEYILEKTKAQAGRDNVDLIAEHRTWLRQWFTQPWFNDLVDFGDYSPYSD